MVQYQLKLRMTKAQAAECARWLYHLAAVWNWAIRKVELNAKDKIYFSKTEFQNLLAHHSQKLGIPSHTLQGILCTAYDAWQRHLRDHTCGLRRPPGRADHEAIRKLKHKSETARIRLRALRAFMTWVVVLVKKK